jgi:hypothetical protein
VSRNKLCRSNFMIQVEGGPHVFTWKRRTEDSDSQMSMY